jgi:hypothetical protein
MDLGSIFGLNCGFEAVWGRITHFRMASLTLAEISFYQRVTSRCFSNFLEDSAPACRSAGHCRIG